HAGLRADRALSDVGAAGLARAVRARAARIGQAVAVVVDAVAHLGRGGVDGSPNKRAIVTIAAHADVTRRHDAAPLDGKAAVCPRNATEAVTVGVVVEGAEHALVDHPVAVVVD